jgi:hypothetical protein
MLIDAVNYDDVRVADEEGRPIAPEHMPTVKELEEKHAARGQVLDAARAAGIE